MADVYELDGTERKEYKEENVPCGIAQTTEWYHPVSGDLLRRDVNIAVDPKFLIGTLIAP